MLFNKKIGPCCGYCLHGSRISPTEVICLKFGVVNADGSCPKFRYDPLKREPDKLSPIKTEAFSTEDFEL